MTDLPRDRLRELLDAVLDESNRTLTEMADDAYSSPFHFSRQLSRIAGEAPVSMRRRVMLERAAWRLRRGTSVTDAAWEAGYESVEGFGRAFARAFGHPPSTPVADHWLPAPNGIHFHPPTSLWVHTTEQAMNPVTEQLVRHDLDDTRYLLEQAKGLSPADLGRPLLPWDDVTSWEGPESTLAEVLDHHIWTKQVWLAAILGEDVPDRPTSYDVGSLLDRHDATAPRWLAMMRDIDRRGAWGDRFVDALCEPPESFVLSSVVAHVITYAAHRRQLARQLLRTLGVEVDQGDPIEWLRSSSRES